MNDTTGKPQFPLTRMAAILTLTIAAMGAVNALVLPRFFGDQPGIAKGAILTAIVVLISCVISALPLSKAMHSGQVVHAFMFGMLIRVGAGAAALVAINAMNLPSIPVVASLMLAYLPALFIETRFIVRHIPALDAWHRQHHGPTAGPTAQTQPGASADGQRPEKLA